MSSLMNTLSQTFPPRTAIANTVPTSAAGELLRPSTPPLPSRSARATLPKLTPGIAFLADAPVRSELLTI
jgi:hypothetical protein